MLNYLSAVALGAAFFISIRKGNLPFAIAIIFYLVLTTGQAFYISGEFELSSSVNILHTEISAEGFRLAQIYSLAVSLAMLCIATFGRSAAAKVRASTVRFRPSKMFYFGIGTWLTVNYLVLVFGVVGIDTFVTSSRPGYQEGSTIFIVMLYVGVLPLLVKLGGDLTPNRADVVLAVAAFIMTAAFSRIHCIFYAVTLLFSVYYGRPPGAGTENRVRQIKIGLFATVAIVLFVSLGAIRDALNFTGASFAEITDFIANNPERSLFSIENNYRFGVEGMSALAGAMSAASADPWIVHYDGGLRWLIQGSLQWVPGALKAHLEWLYTALSYFNWYNGGIVDPGIMESYRSYGWFGIAIFSLMAYYFLWRPCIALRRKRSAKTKVMIVTLLGLSAVFLVRGSWIVWIGYSITYLVIIFGSWPLFYRQMHKA